MTRARMVTDAVWLDVRLALRQWRLAPGFTLLALLVLSTGISANLAMFGLFDAVVVRLLPVHEPDRLISIEAANPKDPDDRPELPYSLLAEFERRQTVLAGVAAVTGAGLTVDTDGVLTQAGIEFASARLFDVLEIRPQLGRLLTLDDVNTAAHVAVMTDEYWRRQYARDPRVVGTIVWLQGIPFTIVGVAARGFSGLSADYVSPFILPITTSTLMEQRLGNGDDQPVTMSYALGRLESGVRIEAARAQLRTTWPAIREANAPVNATDEARRKFLALDLRVSSAARGFSFTRDWWTRPLAMLIAATSWMLLIACVNLASLATSRAIRRRSDIRVRSALGASRGRLVQQELVHSVLLAGAGAALAIPLASWAVRAIGASLSFWGTADFPLLTLQLNWRVVAVIVGSMTLTGIAIGIAPAIGASGRDIHASGTPSRATSFLVSRWAERLLVAQLAAAVVLLIGAALLSQSLARLRTVDTGMLVDGVAILELAQHPGRDPRLDPSAYTTRLTDRLTAVPGVQSVGYSWIPPLMGIDDWRPAVAPAETPLEAGSVASSFVAVSPNFFRTMGIPLQAGREFTNADDNSRPHVAIVSASLAEKLFGGEQSIGRQVRIADDVRLQHVTIVGVVADARVSDLHTKQPLSIYLPLLQASSRSTQTPSSVIMRVTGSWAAMQPAVRRAVESLGQDFVLKQRTLAEQIDRSLLRERWLATGADAFGALATGLVVIGLCGVIGSIVAARTREIGIRAALGASPALLRRMVLTHAARLALIGVAIGVPSAWIATRWIASELTGVSPHDSLTFLVISAALVVVSVLSAWVPARRAAAIDPIEALRSE